MQVKKFEAPTLQEALDHVKRELGPEAIILQTKTNKRGFGLMSKGSVEITAAVSDRAISRKRVTESKLPEPIKEKVDHLPASAQAKVYEKGMDAHLRSALRSSGGDRVELGRGEGTRRQTAPAAGAMAAGSPRIALPSNSGPSLNQQAAGIQKSAGTRALRYAEIDAPEVSEGGSAARGGGDAQLRSEVEELKRMLQELKLSQEETLNQAQQSLNSQGGGARSALSGSLTTPALQDVFEQLTLGGLDKRSALNVIRKVQFELAEQAESSESVLDAAAQELMRMVAVQNPLGSVQSRESSGAQAPTVMALVGPTGVGKTTTIAKIAAEASMRRGLKVGLINLDSYRVAAFDQLATYARLLGVPFRSANSAEDLEAAIADFQSLDLVLLDTTGRSPKDPDALRELNQLLSKLPEVHTYLVMSATTRDTELLETSQRFSLFRPEGLVFSKLDEASVYGSILNVAGRTKLPLCFFTTGQRVPEDLEEATSERLAALILDLH